MKESIKEMEKVVGNLGLVIDQKKESDSIYVVTIPYEKEKNFVIYTTSKMVEHEGKRCFRMHQIAERIPFDSVDQDSIKDFIWKHESYCLERDLPVPSFDANSEEIFVHVYVDMIKKSHKCMDNYHYMFLGISADEVAERMLAYI